MKYRKFGKLDHYTSVLGFGCMRFPMKTNRYGEQVVDQEQTAKMLKYAIDHGVNYFDTAYKYHDGLSESILGETLQGVRKDVAIATKLPVWEINKQGEFQEVLDQQLNRLKTDYIDFYLFHGLNKNLWEQKVLRLDLLKHAEKAKQAGKIRYIGFSFHDDYNTFVSIIDGYGKWDFCQIQYNYLNRNDQAGKKGLKYASNRGLAVIIMEPLLGGFLSNPPDDVGKTFEAAEIRRTPTDWALQWLWNHKEVTMVLSGMGSYEQVAANIDSASCSGIGTMDQKQLEIIERAYSILDGLSLLICVNCKYCLPCPRGIQIPELLSLYLKKSETKYEHLGENRKAYSSLVNHFISREAEKCIHCKQCESKCPQKIKISSWMKLLKQSEKLPHNLQITINNRSK